MGQRMLQLDTTYTGNADNSATLHVGQMPPNPATFPPGPARKCPSTSSCRVGLKCRVGYQLPSSLSTVCPLWVSRS